MRCSAQPHLQVVDSGSWWTDERGRVCRQRLAPGLLWVRGPWLGAQQVQLLLDRGDVGVDALVQQTLLRSVDLLAAGAELPALEQRDLVGKLLNACLAPDELAILHQDLAVGVRQPSQQVLRQRAQLGLAESLELFAGDHGLQCAELRGTAPCANAPIAPGRPTALTPW